jgi:hypothetical protein
MRSHGEPGWPDPDSHGDFRISPEKQHLNGSLMRPADQACRHLLPNGGQLTAAQEQQARGQALKPKPAREVVVAGAGRAGRW